MRSWQYVRRRHAAANGAFERHPRGRRALPALARQDGELRAFRNACRHHHHSVAKGSGTACSSSALPRLDYGLDGRLTKATGIGGIEASAKEHGLEKLPFAQAGVGSFAWLGAPTGGSRADRRLAGRAVGVGARRSRRSARRPTAPTPTSRSRRCGTLRRARSVESNWKVFVDNYLDGGLHVPVAHKGWPTASTLGRTRRRPPGRTRSCSRSAAAPASAAPRATPTSGRT